MKCNLKLFAGIAAAAMLCTAVPFSASAAELMRGDFDGSGDISAADAQLLLQAYTDRLAGLPDHLTDAQRSACDIDGSGSADVADAQLILNYYVCNVVAKKTISWDELLAPPQADDKELATALILKYMEAYNKRDFDTMFEVTNMREVFRASADNVEDVTDEKIREELGDIVELEKYEIFSTVLDTEMLAKYNAEMADARLIAEEQIAAETDPVKLEQMNRALVLIEPIDKLYRFELVLYPKDEQYADEDGRTPETVYVYKQHGEWKIDVMLVKTVDYSHLMKRSSASSAAKAVRLGFLTAMTKLDEQGFDVTKLNGDFFFKSTDFENLTEKPQGDYSNPDVLLELLKYEALQYFSKFTDLEDIAVHLENGVCTQAAVSKKYGSRLWFGSAPTPLDKNAEMYPDIQAALRGGAEVSAS